MPPNVNSPPATSGSYPTRSAAIAVTPDLRLHDALGRVVGDEIGVVNRRQQDPDDAGDRGAADHVRLSPRMSPDREPPELGDQLLGDLLDRDGSPAIRASA